MRSLLPLALILAGCAPAQHEIQTALDLARTGLQAVSLADALLRETYEADQRRCLSLPGPQIDPCIHGVRERYRPVREALEAVRRAWCAFEPEKCGHV
jgi:hypothetical protein